MRCLNNLFDCPPHFTSYLTQILRPRQMMYVSVDLEIAQNLSDLCLTFPSILPPCLPVFLKPEIWIVYALPLFLFLFSCFLILILKPVIWIVYAQLPVFPSHPACQAYGILNKGYFLKVLETTLLLDFSPKFSFRKIRLGMIIAAKTFPARFHYCFLKLKFYNY